MAECRRPNLVLKPGHRCATSRAEGMRRYPTGEAGPGWPRQFRARPAAVAGRDRSSHVPPGYQSCQAFRSGSGRPARPVVFLRLESGPGAAEPESGQRVLRRVMRRLSVGNDLHRRRRHSCQAADNRNPHAIIRNFYSCATPVAWFTTMRCRAAADHLPLETSASVKTAMRICFAPRRSKS